jgi:hypothetical protein
MAERARTTFVVANDKDALILEKLAGIEEMVAALVPLLTQILTHLERQTPPQEVPVASYAQLYAPVEAGPAEGELVAAALDSPAGQLASRWRRWFTKRGKDAPSV